MMLVALLVTASALSRPVADTTITLGTVQRDLTGDGVREVLTLTGAGPAIDDLQVTFTVQSAGRVLYSVTWRLTRRSFDPRRRISDAELRSRLNEYGRWFFADSRFMSPGGYVEWLRHTARLHIAAIPEVISHEMSSDASRARTTWEQMQAAGVTLFQFSSGGDGITAIGWSATDQRFYRLLECC